MQNKLFALLVLRLLEILGPARYEKLDVDGKLDGPIGAGNIVILPQRCKRQGNLVRDVHLDWPTSETTEDFAPLGQLTLSGSEEPTTGLIAISS